MQLTFLGKSSESGESPTLYATDRDSYVVQGYVVDGETLANFHVPAEETVVEVYARLFEHLANDGVRGNVTTITGPIVHVRENGNYLIKGPRLVDDGARAEMAIPAHEDAVELPKACVLALLEGAACD